MTQLTKRIERLEQSATAAQPRTSGWSQLWQNMRRIYGDGLSYSAEELARLDHTPPPSRAEAEAMLARDTHADADA